jgi:hypothetical protein
LNKRASTAHKVVGNAFILTIPFLLKQGGTDNRYFHSCLDKIKKVKKTLFHHDASLGLSILVYYFCTTLPLLFITCPQKEKECLLSMSIISISILHESVSTSNGIMFIRFYLFILINEMAVCVYYYARLSSSKSSSKSFL